MFDANNHRGNFAEAYVRTLASAAGLIVQTQDWDDGIDMTIKTPERRGAPALSRIDVQVKSWTRPEEVGGAYAYDGLDQVQYNQLAVRDYTVERFLFVVVVPPDTGALADLYTAGTLFRYHAFHVSLCGREQMVDPSRNGRKRVHIPKANVLTVPALRGLLELGPVGSPTGGVRP